MEGGWIVLVGCCTFLQLAGVVLVGSWSGFGGCVV